MTPSKAHEKTQTAQRLVKNSAWLFSAEAISKLTALGIQIIAARYLGNKGYGMFSYAFVGTGIVLNFIDLGLRTYVTREISIQPDRAWDLLRSIFFLKRIITFLSIVILCVAYSLIPLDATSLVVISLISSAMILDGYTEIYLGVFRGFERMKEISAFMVLQRILFFLIGLGILALGYGIIEFCFAFLLVSCLSFFVIKKLTNRLGISNSSKWDRAIIKNIIRDSKFICLMILFTYIYFRIDSVLIFFILGKADTGTYTAAFKIIESLALLVAGIRGALFPILSKTYSKDNIQFQRVWRQASRFLLILGLPLSAGMALLGPKLIGVLYGPAYQVTGPILQIMAASLFIVLLNEFIAYLLLAADQTKSAIKIAMAAAIFNVILNSVAIPRWGGIGAACVAGLTELLLFILFARALKNLNISVQFLSLFWRPAFATAGMSLILWEVEASLVPAFFLGVGVYLILIIFLKTFNQFDILVLRNIFNRGNPLQSEPVLKLPEISLPLSIIIVSFKSVDYLTQCLRTIQSNLKNIEHEIIVIDNASNDGSVEVVKRDFPEIILMENEDNLGFSKANNQGIKVSRGRYILLLNNDTEILSGSLETMIDTLEQSPGIGMLGCLLLNSDHTIQESFGGNLGLTQEFFRKAFFNKLYQHSHRSLAKAFLNWIHSTEKDVDWIRGTCMMFPREALIDVGLMDENFFMYFEDVDLSLQLRRKGWDVRFTPKAAIIHHQGVSSSKASYRSAMEYRKSQLYIYKKHYGALGLYSIKLYLYLKYKKNAMLSKISGIFNSQLGKKQTEDNRFDQEILELLKNFR